jgi:steroid delta-isomerase-like uncharacterized protein
MSARNKSVVRRFLEAFVGNDQSSLEELMSSDLVYHHHQMGELDRETHLQGIARLNGAFSDMNIEIREQVAEGDLISTRLIWRGVHTGEFQGLPATNREIAVQGISVERVIDDEVVERWFIQDELGMMQQLGVVPSPIPSSDTGDYP